MKLNKFTICRATSTTNVHLADTSNYRHSSDHGETDLSRKRATSAHSLDRKPDGKSDLELTILWIVSRAALIMFI